MNNVNMIYYHVYKQTWNKNVGMRIKFKYLKFALFSSAELREQRDKPRDTGKYDVLSVVLKGIDNNSTWL